MKKNEIFSKFDLHLKNKKGLLTLAHIIDVAAMEIRIAQQAVDSGAEPVQLIVDSYVEKFDLDTDEILRELFTTRSIIQEILNLKFDNHELCNYVIKANEAKKSWLCFSRECKNPDFTAFKLLNY